jgi:hypothetical protein
VEKVSNNTNFLLFSYPINLSAFSCLTYIGMIDIDSLLLLQLESQRSSGLAYRTISASW